FAPACAKHPATAATMPGRPGHVIVSRATSGRKPSISIDDEAVAVHRLDTARAAAELRRARARDPLADRRSVGGLELDGVAGDEVAVAPEHADREQAAAVLGDRFVGAVVDDEVSGRRLRMPQPEPKGARGGRAR